MYKELRPIQIRVPVETSRSILSLKPEGQRWVTGDRFLDQRFVPTRHIRYSNTHQVMAATATIKAEVLTIRIGRVAQTSAFSRANACVFRQMDRASGSVLCSCPLRIASSRKKLTTRRTSWQTGHWRACSCSSTLHESDRRASPNCCSFSQ